MPVRLVLIRLIISGVLNQSPHGHGGHGRPAGAPTSVAPAPRGPRTTVAGYEPQTGRRFRSRSASQ